MSAPRSPGYLYSLTHPSALHHHPPPLPLSCFSLLRSLRGTNLLREGEAERSPDLHDELFRLDGEKEVEEGNWG